MNSTRELKNWLNSKQFSFFSLLFGFSLSAHSINSDADVIRAFLVRETRRETANSMAESERRKKRKNVKSKMKNGNRVEYSKKINL